MTPLPRRGLLVVYSALMLAILLAALDQTIVSTALPTIVGDLGGLSHLSRVVTAYLLATTADHAPMGQARRPVRPQEAVPRRHRDLPRRLGARAGCPAAHDRADRVPRSARTGRRGTDGARAGDRGRRGPRRGSAASTRGRSELCSGWPAWLARCWAASSCTTSAGGGCSTSTCPSGRSRWP